MNHETDTPRTDACPHCGCQTKDPFGFSMTIHDVDLCNARKINREMKNTTKQIGIIAIVALSFGLVDSLATSLYWRHLAIKHNAAFYETNSWGIPSFKWNDVSFAQAPFQDGAYYSKKMEEAESKRVRSLGIK